MDTFNDFMGQTWDLDDLSIYPDDWKKMNVHDLFNTCTKIAGDSLFYMFFLHSEINWFPQSIQVFNLCKQLSKIWHNLRKWNTFGQTHFLENEAEYRLALMKWRWKFEDETENQC